MTIWRNGQEYIYFIFFFSPDIPSEVRIKQKKKRNIFTFGSHQFQLVFFWHHCFYIILLINCFTLLQHKTKLKKKRWKLIGNLSTYFTNKRKWLPQHVYHASISSMYRLCVHVSENESFREYWKRQAFEIHTRYGQLAGTDENISCLVLFDSSNIVYKIF